MPKLKVEGFQQLNELVSVNYPSKPASSITTTSTTQPPSLIVYCSWMGAAPKHISKYTDGYRRLFPSATILLVQCTIKSLLVSPAFIPAYDVIQLQHDNLSQTTAAESDESRPKIALCMSSNGGVTNGVRLARHFQHNSYNGTVFDVIILDSAPGLPDLARGANAFTVSLPQCPLARTIGYYVICVLLLLWVAIDRLLGKKEDVMMRLRRDLNDEKLFPLSAPKLYLFSKNDAMVGWEAVHKHAEDARKAGYKNVKEEIFQRAPHCALVNEDAHRYWSEIRDHLALKS